MAERDKSPDPVRREMPLIFPDSSVPREELLQMFHEFVQELSGERQLLQSPPGEVRDLLRLETLLHLVDDVLEAVKQVEDGTASREELARWINIQYDVSQVAVQGLKGAIALPSVPKKKAG